MKKTEMEDELRPEYDLKSLRVRKFGPERKNFGGSTVILEPDVAEVFPDAESVNEALRFLIRVTKENKPVLPTTLYVGIITQQFGQARRPVPTTIEI